MEGSLLAGPGLESQAEGRIAKAILDVVNRGKRNVGELKLEEEQSEGQQSSHRIDGRFVIRRVGSRHPGFDRGLGWGDEKVRVAAEILINTS